MARISEIIENIIGAVNSQDDIIIYANSKDELKNRTIELKAVRESGLKLWKSKCKFEMSELTFLGHKISGKGVEVDKEKVDAILNMPDPTNKKELQRFLGMVNYLGKFVPNLANETAPLRQLLEKESVWSMDKPQCVAIEKLKSLVTNAPILKFYNPELSIRVSSDASKDGLGAVIEQKHEEN